MARYEAVIFDLFGTLIDNVSMDSYVPALREMARAIRVDPETFATAWRNEDLSRQRSVGQLANPEDMVHACCELLGVKPSVRAIHQAANVRRKMYADWVHPRPGVLDMLGRIRGAGLKIALMSGCTAEVPELWDSTEMSQYIQVALFSCDLGMNKPEAAFYEAAVDAMGVEPGRCLYVGDGADNELAGAVDLGMDAVLFCMPHERSIVMARAQCRHWVGKSVTCPEDLLGILGLNGQAEPLAFDIDGEEFEQTLSDSIADAMADSVPAGPEAVDSLIELDPDEISDPSSQTASAEPEPEPESEPKPPSPPPLQAVSSQISKPSRKGQSPFRAVCLGLYGTLVANPDPAATKTVLRRVAGRLALDPEKFCKIWLAEKTRQQRMSGALASPSAAIRYVCEELLAEPREDEIRHALTCLFEFGWLGLLPSMGVLPVLRKLHGLGWKMACIGQCSVEIPHYWARTAFEPLFDAAVFTCQQRADIDSPQLYIESAERLGTPVGRCCYISDKPDQLAAAEQAGMGAALYNPSGADRNWSGRQIDELAKIMRALR